MNQNSLIDGEQARGVGFVWERVVEVMGSSGGSGEVERSGEEGSGEMAGKTGMNSNCLNVGGKDRRTPGSMIPGSIPQRGGSPVAYRLRLPEELTSVHDTFHVSNLKKCLADPTLQVPLDEIQVDARLNFVEEHMEILEREFKKLKRSRISIVKVC
nr:reverse transcriptase domain-containing protein [Tanacetum cinerariifolium]